MSNDEASKPSSSRSKPGTLLLGILSVGGLLGFVIAYGLLLNRGAPPQSTAPVVSGEAVPAVAGREGASGPRGPAGPKGDAGPRGERGPQGTPGDAGIRMIRQACAAGDCTVECADGEMLLTAHCGIGRNQAIYPTEKSALCRSRGTARVEVVAACVKLSP